MGGIWGRLKARKHNGSLNIYRYGDFEETAKLLLTYRTYYSKNRKWIWKDFDGQHVGGLHKEKNN